MNANDGTQERAARELHAVQIDRSPLVALDDEQDAAA